ncbi:YitT family protein [endosymbiont GvMRE of Glomus versiforme]|uniref:YitT family protein n=1 Tax=endosymbiont GvMRE of Glomus versiforme TaxID=2039283 RepID=UPI000EE9F7E7|nr:YitT family protein [endosymbiont GvMRE of Glomus versiforme]RHZ36510.1 hypothetical protein GvMRE_I2g507 [endosymbiont GvMRE of Glomus versiforme]
MKKKKKIEVPAEDLPRKDYQVWKRYGDIIRSLHRDSKRKKVRQREKTLSFLVKLGIVFFAAFFTTLAFTLLLSPNGIYNSGLNGLLQAIFNLLSGYNEGVRANNTLFLFGTAFLINLLIIVILRRFFQGKLEMLSTALVYSLAQLIWSKVFDKLNLSTFMFNNFSPESWGFGREQLGFTLPFYVTIALLASLIHTYGYSLIFKARATPGGLEIITAHLSSKKKAKVSLGVLFKFFGFLVVFLITVISFLGIDDNPKVKKAELKTYLWGKNNASEKEFLNAEEDLDQVLKKWKKKYQIKNDLEKENSELEKEINQEKDPEIKQKNEKKIHQNQQKILALQKENAPLTTYLKLKIGSEYIEDYPEEEVKMHLMNREELRNALKKEIAKREKETSSPENKKTRKYLIYLKKRQEKNEKEIYEKTPTGYFKGYVKYVTNNEKLWATLVYIFLSAFLISQMFPKDIKVILNVQTNSRDKLDKILALLKEFKPVYYVSHLYEQKTSEEKIVYIVSCSLTKWGYYLLQQDLQDLKVIFFISEIN